MSLQLSIILTLVLQICALKSDKPFVEIVDDVFKGSENLMLAAFTDLDADKSTDLLYLSKGWLHSLVTHTYSIFSNFYVLLDLLSMLIHPEFA